MFLEDDARYEAMQELDLGEKLLWCCAPNARLQMRRSLPWVLLGVVITAAAAWFTYDASRTGPLWLAGLPIVLIGAMLMVYPPMNYLRARMTSFAVTNHRLLVIQGGSSRNVKSYQIRHLKAIRCEEGTNGGGNVKFSLGAYTDDSNCQVKAVEVEFTDLPDVSALEVIVQQTFAEQLLHVSVQPTPAR